MKKITILIFIIVLQGIFVSHAALRDTKPDTWVGGSVSANCFMPTFEEVGAPRANKEVGIYYFIWHAEHHAANYAVRNLTKIEQGLQELGELYTFHFWDEPFLGYYDMQDPFVIRKHAQMLTDAGVDVIFVDNTNNYLYADTFKTLIDVYAQMRAEGNDTPYICSMMHNVFEVSCPKELYETFFAPEVDPDLRAKVDALWYKRNGKYFLLADRNQTLNNAESPSFFQTAFEIKTSWTDENIGKHTWPWCGTNWSAYGYAEDPSVIEETYVMTADTALARTGRSTRRDGSNSGDPGKGSFFADQWEKALSMDPHFVLVTQFNEWMAQRQPNNMFPDGIPFVDMWGRDASRDIEPMYCFDDKGGFGDNFIYYLSYYVRKYKGVREIPTAKTMHTIDVGGDFAQWEMVESVYLDDLGDTVHRDFPAAYVDSFRTDDAYYYRKDGIAYYRNDTGRNDFDTMKVAFDSYYIYFYVKTKEDITPMESESTWMQLLLNTNAVYTDGWQGYDFLVNRQNDAQGFALLEKSVGGWQWETVGEVACRTEGKEMMLAIPRAFLGYTSIAKKEVMLDFKWMDHVPVGEEGINPMDFIDKGDVAPNARFNYRYRALLPETKTQAVALETLCIDSGYTPDVESFILSAIEPFVSVGTSVQFFGTPTNFSIADNGAVEELFGIGSYEEKLRYHVLDKEGHVVGIGIAQITNESIAPRVMCDGKHVGFAVDRKKKVGVMTIACDTAPWHVVFSETAEGTFYWDGQKIDGFIGVDLYTKKAEGHTLTYTYDGQSVSYAVDIVWDNTEDTELKLQAFALMDADGKEVSNSVFIDHENGAVYATVPWDTELSEVVPVCLATTGESMVTGKEYLWQGSCEILLYSETEEKTYTVHITQDIAPKLMVQNVAYQKWEIDNYNNEITLTVQKADVENMQLCVLSDGQIQVEGDLSACGSPDVSEETTLVYREGAREKQYQFVVHRETMPPTSATFRFRDVYYQKFSLDHQTKTITASIPGFVPMDSMNLLTMGEGITYLDGKNTVHEWFNLDGKETFSLSYSDGGMPLIYTFEVQRGTLPKQNAYPIQNLYAGNMLPTQSDLWQTVERGETGAYSIGEAYGEKALLLSSEGHHIVSVRDALCAPYVFDFDVTNRGEQWAPHYGTMLSLRNQTNNDLITTYSGIGLVVLGNQLMVYVSDARGIGFADNNNYSIVTMEQDASLGFVTIRVIDQGDKIVIRYQNKNGRFLDAFVITEITEKTFSCTNVQTGKQSQGSAEGISATGYLCFFRHGGLGAETYLKNLTLRGNGVAKQTLLYAADAMPSQTDAWQTIARGDTGEYRIAEVYGEKALMLASDTHHIVSTKQAINAPYRLEFDVANTGDTSMAHYGAMISLRNQTNYDLVTTYSGIWLDVLGDRLMLYVSEARGAGFADIANYSVVTMNQNAAQGFVTLRVLDLGNQITVWYQNAAGMFCEAFVIEDIQEKSFAYENRQTRVRGLGSSEGIMKNGYVSIFHHGGLGVDTYYNNILLASAEIPKDSRLLHLALVDAEAGKNAVQNIRIDEQTGEIHAQIIPESSVSALRIRYIASVADGELLYHGVPAEEVTLHGEMPVPLLYTDGETEISYKLYVTQGEKPGVQEFYSQDKVKLGVINSTDTEKDNASFYVAFYDENQRLIRAVHLIHTIKRGVNILDLNVGEVMPQKTTVVRLFSWDGLCEITPILSAQTYGEGKE